MHDAGELLLVLYKHLTPVAVRAGQPELLDHIFGLSVQVMLVILDLCVHYSYSYRVPFRLLKVLVRLMLSQLGCICSWKVLGLDNPSSSCNDHVLPSELGAHDSLLLLTRMVCKQS